MMGVSGKLRCVMKTLFRKLGEMWRWLFGIPQSAANTEVTTDTIIAGWKGREQNVKDLPQALELLWRQYFDNFSRRQSYEWKMVVVLWTPIVLYIGYGLTERLVYVPMPFAVVAAIAYLAVHCFWQFNLARRNAGDINAFRDIADHMREIVGLKAFEARYAVGQSGLRMKDWGHRTYLIITVLLLVGANMLNVTADEAWVVMPRDIVAKVKEKAKQDNTSFEEAMSALVTELQDMTDE